MPSKSYQFLNHAPILEWLRDVRCTKRFNHLKTAVVFGMRLGMAGLFLTALTAVFQPLVEKALASPNQDITEFMKNADSIGGDLIALFIIFLLALIPWLFSTKRRYPMLEIETLNLTDLPLLLRAMRYKDAELHEEVAELLCPLLREMQASDAACLTHRDRKTLYSFLSVEHAESKFEFINASLTALEKVGDGEALFYVRRLAQSRSASNPGERVVWAARHCLRVMEVRHAKEQTQMTLLRPVLETPFLDNLLRPAQTAPDNAPEQLLHRYPVE